MAQLSIERSNLLELAATLDATAALLSHPIDMARRQQPDARDDGRQYLHNGRTLHVSHTSSAD